MVRLLNSWVSGTASTQWARPACAAGQGEIALLAGVFEHRAQPLVPALACRRLPSSVLAADHPGRPAASRAGQCAAARSAATRAGR